LFDASHASTTARLGNCNAPRVNQRSVRYATPVEVRSVYATRVLLFTRFLVWTVLATASGTGESSRTQNRWKCVPARLVKRCTMDLRDFLRDFTVGCILGISLTPMSMECGRARPKVIAPFFGWLLVGFVPDASTHGCDQPTFGLRYPSPRARTMLARSGPGQDVKRPLDGS